ncbi:hypothetical protein D3C72_2306860 [compost metagenome]
MLCITAVLQCSQDLFAAELIIAIGIEALDQVGEEGRRHIGIQIAIGSRAIDLFKTDLQPVMLTQQLDLRFLDILS